MGSHRCSLCLHLVQLGCRSRATATATATAPDRCASNELVELSKSSELQGAFDHCVSRLTPLTPNGQRRELGTGPGQLYLFELQSLDSERRPDERANKL